MAPVLVAHKIFSTLKPFLINDQNQWYQRVIKSAVSIVIVLDCTYLHIPSNILSRVSVPLVEILNSFSALS